MSLQIIQAKPNPAGKVGSKDQNSTGEPEPQQLFGEWVDIKNIGNDSVHFSTIQVRHALFDDKCYTTGETELYWLGASEDFLKPNQVLRIHAGKREDSRLMTVEDQEGADWHSFVEGEDFVLNIMCGDKIIITWRDSFDQGQQDWACYAPHPPEDTILKRSGNLLSGAGVGLTV
jgi:hypothetical protein